VWSWRPDAGAKLAMMPRIIAGDGGNKARSPRRARRKLLKPSRREGRVISASPVATTLCLLPMHRGHGCGQHPAFPAPSVFREGQYSCKARANCVAGTWSSVGILVVAEPSRRLLRKLLRLRASCMARSSNPRGETLMVRSASSRVSNHEACEVLPWLFLRETAKAPLHSMMTERPS
jgi:hypothetical protein